MSEQIKQVSQAIRLEDFTILKGIEARLQQIMPEQVGFVARYLHPVGKLDTLIGKIQPPTTLLWVLSSILKADHDLEIAKALQPQPEDVANDHKQRAMIADELRDVVMELMWAQARTDLGYWEADGVGIRAGWVLVSTKNGGPHAALAGLLGIKLPGE